MKTFVSVCCMCLLAGCVTGSSVKRVESGCLDVSAALKVLTTANNAGKLSPQVVSAVDKARAITGPVCRDPSQPLDSLKQRAFDAALAELALYAAGVH